MSDTEPPSSAGHPEPHGSPSLLRNFLRMLRPQRGPRESLDAVIAAAEAEGGEPITAEERTLIGNIFKVHDRSAADAMVPRVDIVALEIEQPFGEVVKCMVEHGHSRVPVYRESLTT